VGRGLAKVKSKITMRREEKKHHRLFRRASPSIIALLNGFILRSDLTTTTIGKKGENEDEGEQNSLKESRSRLGRGFCSEKRSMGGGGDRKERHPWNKKRKHAKGEGTTKLKMGPGQHGDGTNEVRAEGEEG